MTAKATLSKGELAAVCGLTSDTWSPRPTGVQMRTLLELERRKLVERQAGKTPPRWKLLPAALHASADPGPVEPKKQTPIAALLSIFEALYDMRRGKHAEELPPAVCAQLQICVGMARAVLERHGVHLYERPAGRFLRRAG
jgi:hypothetical protein